MKTRLYQVALVLILANGVFLLPPSQANVGLMPTSCITPIFCKGSSSTLPSVTSDSLPVNENVKKEPPKATMEGDEEPNGQDAENQEQSKGLQRHFIFNNALGIDKGSWYYQNIGILFNHFQYGVSDNFSIGFGIIPNFTSSYPTSIWVIPSFSIPIVENKLSLAVGGILLGRFGDEPGLGILAKTTATWGSPEKNFTFGLLYGYDIDDGWGKFPMPYLSGMLRIKKNHTLIAENFLVKYGETLMIGALAGGRFHFDGWYLDYGFDLSESGVILGFTIPFGRKKDN